MMNKGKKDKPKRVVKSGSTAVKSQRAAFFETFISPNRRPEHFLVRHTEMKFQAEVGNLTNQLKSAIEEKDAAISTATETKSMLETAILEKNTAVKAENAAINTATETKNKLETAISEKNTAVEAGNAAINTATETKNKLETAILEKNTATEAKNDAILAKNAAIETATKAKSELETAIKDKNGAIEEKDAAIETAAKAKSELETAISVKNSAVEEKDNAISAKEAAIETTAKTKSDLESAISAKNSAIEDKNGAIEEKDDATSAKDAAIETAAKAKSELESAISAKNSAIEDKNGAIETAAKAKSELETAQRSNESLSGEIEELKGSTKQLEQKITKNSKILQQVTSEKKKVSGDLKNVLGSNKLLRGNIEELTLEKKTASKDLKNVQRSYKSLRGNIKELENGKELQLTAITDLKKKQAQDKVNIDALTTRLNNTKEDLNKAAMNFSNLYSQNEFAKKEWSELSAKCNTVELKNKELHHNLTEVSLRRDKFEQDWMNLNSKSDDTKNMLESSQTMNRDLRRRVSELEGQAAQNRNEITKEVKGKRGAEEDVRKCTLAYDTLIKKHEDCQRQLTDLAKENEKLSKEAVGKMTVKEYVEKHGSLPLSSNITDDDILQRPRECSPECRENIKNSKSGHCIICPKSNYFDADATVCCDGKYTVHMQKMKAGKTKVGKAKNDKRKNEKRKRKSASASTETEASTSQNSGLRIKIAVPSTTSTLNKKRRNQSLPMQKSKQTQKKPVQLLCCARDLCDQDAGIIKTGNGHRCKSCEGRMHGFLCSDGKVQFMTGMTCKKCAAPLLSRAD